MRTITRYDISCSPSGVFSSPSSFPLLKKKQNPNKKKTRKRNLALWNNNHKNMLSFFKPIRIHSREHKQTGAQSVHAVTCTECSFTHRCRVCAGFNPIFNILLYRKRGEGFSEGSTPGEMDTFPCNISHTPAALRNNTRINKTRYKVTTWQP